MEIREIINYHFNMIFEMLEVSFKTLEDEVDAVRNDKISYYDIESIGFENLTFRDIDDDNEDDDFDLFGIDDSYDEDEIISFLNEYYLIFPERIPKSELI